MGRKEEEDASFYDVVKYSTLRTQGSCGELRPKSSLVEEKARTRVASTIVNGPSVRICNYALSTNPSSESVAGSG